MQLRVLVYVQMLEAGFRGIFSDWVGWPKAKGEGLVKLFSLYRARSSSAKADKF